MQRKNLFSMDVSKDDSQYECQQFKVRGISAALKKESDELNEELDKYIEKAINSSLFLPMIKVFLPVIAVFLFAIGIYFYSLGSVVVAIVMLALAGVSIGLIKTLSRVEKNKEEKRAEKDNDFTRRQESFERASRSYLNVPDSAPEIDVFTNLYGSEYFEDGEFGNCPMTVFGEDGKLCFYCENGIYGIPTEKIEEIAYVVRDTTFFSWEKEEPFDSEEYAEYGMKEDDDGVVSIGAYYSVRFSDGGEDYEIVIPPYDIDEILKITGKKANFETPVDLGDGVVIGKKEE